MSFTDPFTDPAYQSYLYGLSEDQRKKARRRTRRSGSPYYYAGDQPTSGFGAQYGTGNTTQPLMGTGGGAQTLGSTQTNRTTDAQYSTNPDEFNRGVEANALLPYPGSAAEGYAGVGKVPDATQMAATDPYLQADVLMNQRYGLPAGSRSAGLFGSYLGGTDDRAMALGVYSGLDSNADWINFGASLMNNATLQQGGAQLNPKTMIQTLVQTALAESNAMKSGGAGSSDEYSPLAAMMSQNPQAGISQFVNIVKGALAGTMPEDQLNGYVSWLAKAAQQFVTSYVTGAEGSVGEQEAAGRNWLSALVTRLGPSLGL